MKNVALLLGLVLLLSACSKTDTAVRSEHYTSVTYRIVTGDSNVSVQYRVGVYEDQVKGNITQDTLLTIPGDYRIPAKVLTGEQISLFGSSTKSGNFKLQIIGTGNNVLVETDTIPYDPANQLHEARWYATIFATP